MFNIFNKINQFKLTVDSLTFLSIYIDFGMPVYCSYYICQE